MRFARPLLLLPPALLGVACGMSDGPGYYPAYMVHFQRVALPTEVAHADWQAPGTVAGLTPTGLWVVDTPQDGRWLYDPDSDTPLYALPNGPLWITQTGLVLFDGATAEYRTHGNPSAAVPITAPEDLAQLTDFAVDPQRDLLFAAGVSPLANLGPTGQVYRSEDHGQSWELITNMLEPIQGDAASVTFIGVAGFQRVGVCPASGIYEGGSPVCEDYRLFEGATSRGYVYNLPTPIGWDDDGRVLATCDPEVHGRPYVGLVTLDADQSDESCLDLKPVVGSFLPEGGLATVDLDGHLWTQGWNLEDYGAFRSTAPAGERHDQRRTVLEGWGCEDYFRRDLEGGPTGRTQTFTVRNGRDEPISLHVVLNHRPQGANAQIGADPIPPGGEVNLERPENDWFMALTFDGRCAGFGQVKRLDGRTL